MLDFGDLTLCFGGYIYKCWCYVNGCTNPRRRKVCSIVQSHKGTWQTSSRWRDLTQSSYGEMRGWNMFILHAHVESIYATVMGSLILVEGRWSNVWDLGSRTVSGMNSHKTERNGCHAENWLVWTETAMLSTEAWIIWQLKYILSTYALQSEGGHVSRRWGSCKVSVGLLLRSEFVTWPTNRCLDL